MAYFANGTEGEILERQCEKCILNVKPCPIWFAQTDYNYDAMNNETATKILNSLVNEDGICQMYELINEK